MNSKFLTPQLSRLLRIVFTSALFAALLLMLPAAPVAQAAGFVVNTTADAVDVNPGDGVCATATGACTLRAAIMEANAHPGADTITLPAGTYDLTIRGYDEDAATTGDLDITDNLTLIGAGADSTFIVGAKDIFNPNDRVFDVIQAVATISGVTIQGGTAGSFNQPVPLPAEPGGGIRIRSGSSLTLTFSVVRDNAAANGVGIDVGAGAALRLENSTVSGNSDRYGPGSGGMENRGSAIIENSTISANTGVYSGGISNWGTLVIANSTISGNRMGYAGGIWNFASGTVAINSSTITNNNGMQVGGVENSGTLVIKNTVLGGNIAGMSGADCHNYVGSGGYNLIENVTGCIVLGDPTGNLIGVSPNLGALKDNGGPTFTHAVVPGSPALDAGNPAAPGSGGNACPAMDQRGMPRAGRCDIGAFEFQQDTTPPIITITSPQAKEYLHTATFQVAWNAVDTESGLASESATLDGNAATKGQTVDLFYLALGQHKVTVTAKDKAGNTGTLSVTFNVVANIDSLIAAKERACALGWINSVEVCSGLGDKLLAAKGAIGRGQNSTAKNQLIGFLNQLEAQNGKAVNLQAYNLLKADAQYLIDHLP